MIKVKRIEIIANCIDMRTVISEMDQIGIKR